MERLSLWNWSNSGCKMWRQTTKLSTKLSTTLPLLGLITEPKACETTVFWFGVLPVKRSHQIFMFIQHRDAVLLSAANSAATTLLSFLIRFTEGLSSQAAPSSTLTNIIMEPDTRMCLCFLQCALVNECCACDYVRTERFQSEGKCLSVWNVSSNAELHAESWVVLATLNWS